MTCLLRMLLLLFQLLPLWFRAPRFLAASVLLSASSASPVCLPLMPQAQLCLWLGFLSFWV